jgi:hypothetical protein
MASSFDPDKDELIREIDQLESGKMILVVQLRRYNGGPQKVAVQREGTSKDGKPYYRPMGRLTLEEAEWLAGTLKKANT